MIGGTPGFGKLNVLQCRGKTASSGRKGQPLKQILTLCAVMLFGFAAQAQTMAGLKIGDDTAAATKTLGAPAEQNKTIAFTQLKWKLPNGNELIANADSSGKIQYIETSWNQEGGNPQTGVYDFAFGKTTLAEVRTKFGSGGMSYAKRPPLLTLPEGAVLVTSFEVGPVVMTFYGVVLTEDVVKAREDAAKGGFALYAKLDSISVTTPEFAKVQWGDPMYPANYKKGEVK